MRTLELIRQLLNLIKHFWLHYLSVHKPWAICCPTLHRDIGYLAMSANIFGCHHLGSGCYLLLGGQGPGMLLNILQWRGQGPTTKKHPFPNINRAEIENPYTISLHFLFTSLVLGRLPFKLTKMLLSSFPSYSSITLLPSSPSHSSFISAQAQSTVLGCHSPSSNH